MNLYVYTNKQGKVFYYVKHSYRDKNGKSTSRIVEKLGTHEELLRQHDDPKAWAQEYVAELNRKEAEQAQPVTVTYSPTKQISERDGALYYGGYLFLQKRDLQIQPSGNESRRRDSLL